MNKQWVGGYIPGQHNADIVAAQERLRRGQTYQDLSTVCVIPTRGGRSLAPRAVSSWMSLMRPMNQMFIGPLFISGHEVGEAYNEAVELVLSNPGLAKMKYLLTIEDDNLPPPDGLLKLFESLNGKVDGEKYDVVGGLYWTKGEGGQPMIYGNPKEFPLSFRPQMPVADTVQRANGLGMGFNLFRLSMFKKIDKPWFKTVQDYTEGQGGRGYTQDLYFYENAAKKGFRFACDTRVRVGHLDIDNDRVW